jgi:hypothetical protein
MFSMTGENPWLVRVTRLRYQVLSGAPYVHVSPVEWQVDPDNIRRLARDRGYVEIPPMFQGCLSFQHAPHLLPPRPAFDHTETEPNRNRERWLLNRLDGTDEVWISVRHAKLSTRHITDLAAREGMRVVREYADPADRILLLSRNPEPPRLPLPLPLGRKRFRYSFLTWAVPAANFLLCFAGAFIASALTGYDQDEPLPTLFFAAALVLTFPLSFIVNVFPRTTKVGWLAKEFNGNGTVQFALSTFGVSEDLAVQIAAHHGYTYSGYTSSRMRGRYLMFAKQV